MNLERAEQKRKASQRERERIPTPQHVGHDEKGATTAAELKERNGKE